ncbi:MAG: hypothetical protein JWN70_1374 [Planctomycetaceae bacterium]|nr:hypothetical protein [Planctomycetaceae bacterium]
MGKFVVSGTIWFAATLLLASTMLNPTVASAAGHEASSRDQDIILQVDSRWPGNAYGGYFPLRIKLSNMGAPRSLTVVFEGVNSARDDALPKVYRAVRVEQQATIHFTLSIPMVSTGTQGIVRVYAENGAELKGLSSRHALPEFGGAVSRASMLIISTDDLDDKQMQPFEDAAATECANLSSIKTAAGGRGGYYSSAFLDKDHIVVQPAQNLPLNWIDYSGIDLVAVNWKDWSSRLTGPERDAILKWTATGGVLLIYGTGQPAAKHTELNQTLQLKQDPAGWTTCFPDRHRTTEITTSGIIRTGAGHSPATPMPGPVDTPPWKISTETYSYRDWVLGQVHVFPDNPFPGTANDWCWWLSSLPKNVTQWPRKLGMSSRTDNSEFLTFLIPGVGTVPVFAFLCLITVFTLVIGPLNYYWLYKRRRLALMVLTVPVIAGVTCVLLFAYSLIADGFSIRSRIHSFTWLDQQRKSAVTLSRLSLYAPFAPSTGLKFSPECAVFPLWQPGTGGFEGGSVDWSANDQRLSSAWFRSQTWTQFQTIENRDERGRLDYKPPTDPKAPTLAVSNGLSWDLEYLAVKVTDSDWFAGGPIPAGATADLKRVKRTEVAQRFQEATDKTAWLFPEGMSSAPYMGRPYGMSSRYYGGYQRLETSLKTGLLAKCSTAAGTSDAIPQRELYDWRDGQTTNSKTRPHAAALKPLYWAISQGNPGVQAGVKSAIDSKSLHLLFGTF